MKANRASHSQSRAGRVYFDTRVAGYAALQNVVPTRDVDSSELDDEDTADEDDPKINSPTRPGMTLPKKSYATGPLPLELANEVCGLTNAFNDALANVARKYNRPLHQVERLANLNSTLKVKRSANPFNGYARKRKKEGLPTRKLFCNFECNVCFLIVSSLCL